MVRAKKPTRSLGEWSANAMVALSVTLMKEAAAAAKAGVPEEDVIKGMRLAAEGLVFSLDMADQTYASEKGSG